MSRFLILLAAISLFCANQAAAQARYVLNYQGELRSASGDPLFPNSAQNITFKVYSAPMGGSPLYTETVNSVPIDANGRFNTNLGGSGTFVNHFSGGDRYLQITVAGNDILPRQLVTGTPYAFAAQNLLGNVAESQLPQNQIDSSELQDGSVTGTDIQNGTITGDDVHPRADLSVDTLVVTSTNGSVNARVGFDNGDGRFGRISVHDLSGNELAYMTARSSGDLWVGDKVSGLRLEERSDRRLKKDFRNVENALERLNGINAYLYSYKNPPENREGMEEVGYIAQEIQAVLPEAVSQDKNGNLTVRPSALVALLIQSVKDQQAEIEQLRDRVNQMESTPLIGELPETEESSVAE